MCKTTINVCLFLVVLTLPCMVSATGLGKLTLNSSLGQPFKAKIDLVSVKKEDIPSISVSLASLDTFRLVNIDYARFLRTFVFSIENRDDGQPYVRLTSSQPVTEASFSMLVELNWSSGSLIREYTIQLVEDMAQSALPVIQLDEPEVPVSAEPESMEPEQSDSRALEGLADGEGSTLKEMASESKMVSEQAPELQQNTVSAERPVTTYGPVKSGDTLTKIAQERIFYNIQLNQILIALLRANREAFIDNNINQLKTGYMLQIPNESEVLTISPDIADKEVQMQMANWEAYRQRLVIEVDSIPYLSEDLEQTATGEISTTVLDDSSAEMEQESGDGLLRLSKGMESVAGPEEGNGEDAISIQEKFNIVEDNSVAGEKALNEANKRISLLEQAMEENRIANEEQLSDSNQRIMDLERNIKELQRLLELKSTTLASVEARAENILSEASDSPPMKIEKSTKVAQPTVNSVERKESNQTEESNQTIINWILWMMILLLIIGLWWKVKQSRADLKSSDTL